MGIGGSRFGAGRPGWRRKCEQLLALDVRVLARRRRLASGMSYSWAWSRGGEPAGNISIQTASDHVRLAYTWTPHQADPRHIDYSVRLERTPCHYGGSRPWFVCPRCYSRRTVLYGTANDGRFGCRKCMRLAAIAADYPVAQAQQTSGATEKAVMALENQWTESQRTNNVDLLTPLIADKFVYTGTDGKVSNRAELLAEAKSTKWTSVENENMHVTVFSDTAIVTGGFIGQGTAASGKPINDHTRFTDVWMKMPNGKWQCVSSQDSPVKM
jgi:ketosteroid isomerase-like protein